jgi:hypothetical protein
MHTGVCSNPAESYFSRVRRIEIGTNHYLPFGYINAYVDEAVWREDYRGLDNCNQAAIVGLRL